MSKNIREKSFFNWADEVKRLGAKWTFLDRIIFHNGLTVAVAMQNTGFSKKTCAKWFNKLIEEGKIYRASGTFKITKNLSEELEKLNLAL